jgi:hypothetical protein
MAILNIPITKAGNRPIEVDPDILPDAMYRLALEEGLKVLLNKGMTKILTAKLEGEELESAQAAAYAKAEENLSAVKAGTLTKGRATVVKGKDGKKLPAAILTEARRLAKEVAKNEIRAAGMKISHVPASEITKAANAFIAADPYYIEQATKNIEERSTKKVAVDIASLVHESPALVAASEKVKAERKAASSAKQAGKPKAAARKGQQASAH